MEVAAGASKPGLSSVRARKRLGFLDLPIETQNLIVSHCSQADLVCLSVVSHHFRDLAARQLYRIFHIVFPDEEDPAFESPIDSLAAGLETFVTSEYDYAAHLRQISMDTLVLGPKSEKAYRPYLFKLSCGKFMNTLLLLTLKKARCLESFRWNIRVELSRPVYKALHNIESIKKVHIRLQAGKSLYEPLPNLPYTTAYPPNPHWHWADETEDPNNWNPPPQSQYILVSHGPYTQPVFKHKSKAVKRPPPAKEPPTVSGFKNLRSLSVLDIDNHDIIGEVRACIKNSASTLRKLRLSFSDALASSARRPPPDPESEDSEDDEFQIPPPPQYEPVAQRHLRIQEERKRQEAVLAKIFDIGLSSATVKQSTTRPLPIPPGGELATAPPEVSADGVDAENAYIRAILSVSSTLAERCLGTTGLSGEQSKDLLDMIASASKLYVETRNKQAKEKESEEKPAEGSGQTMDPLAGQVLTGAQRDGIENLGAHIDMAHADSDKGEDFEEGDVDQDNEASNTNGVSKESESLAEDDGQDENTAKVLTSMENSQTEEGPDDSAANESLFSGAGMQSPKGKGRATDCDVAKTDGSSMGAMREYLYNSHGMALRELAVCLIPIRASVLSRSLDLHVLEKVTLLNVGNQIPFWTTMAKENSQKPLRLRSIFTDHVTPAFLQFVGQLRKVHELLLLERSTKYRPESLAPKMPVTIDQIRRLALKPHMHTLKRLMLKDCSEQQGWDLNSKTTTLICSRGARLEELAISLGVHALHGLIQHLAGLARLRALHILHFRNSDTCIWVMRESLRFIVDCVAHNPHLRLEWIAIEDERVDRIMRPHEFEDEAEAAEKAAAKKAKKAKEKLAKHQEVFGGGSKTEGGPSDNNDAAKSEDGGAIAELPVLPVDGWDYSDSGSEDDMDPDEEDQYGSDSKLKLRTMSGVQFFDVWGVKIFSKEVRSGRI